MEKIAKSFGNKDVQLGKKLSLVNKLISQHTIMDRMDRFVSNTLRWNIRSVICKQFIQNAFMLSVTTLKLLMRFYVSIKNLFSLLPYVFMFYYYHSRLFLIPSKKCIMKILQFKILVFFRLSDDVRVIIKWLYC